MPTSQELNVHEELRRAAADLEALASELEKRTGQVERLESYLDALLDDLDLDVCLVGDDLCIRALSRGMADRLSAADTPVGRRIDQVASVWWDELREAFDSLDDDRWQERDVQGGRLRIRRCAAPDAEGTEVLFVLRFTGR